MKLTELRDVLFDFIQDYFAGAIVEWGELPLGTKPQNPFISLKMGSMKRPQHFITETTNEAVRSYIPTTAYIRNEFTFHNQ